MKLIIALFLLVMLALVLLTGSPEPHIECVNPTVTVVDIGTEHVQALVIDGQTWLYSGQGDPDPGCYQLADVTAIKIEP